MSSLALNLLLVTCSMSVALAANFAASLSIQQVYTPRSDGDINRKFLRAVMIHLPPELIVTRNSTGHVIEVGGVGMLSLEWLSRALNFEYILLPDIIRTVEDNAIGKGTMSWIVEGRADLILTSVTFSPTRYKNLNYLYPFVISQYGLLILMPSAQVNVAAVWKPFQQQVWIYFVVSLFATTGSLYGISYGVSAFLAKKESKSSVEVTQGKVFERFSHALAYVIGVLLSQSVLAHKGTSRDQKLSIRILAGVWCVTCFVIVTAYSSVLISFVTSPYYKPLINSLSDFPKDPKIQITVDRGLFPDILFTNAVDGIYKFLGDQLRRDPELRCSTTELCLDKVRNGSYVYTQGEHTLKSYIGMGVKKTGRCDFTIVKERYNSYYAALTVAKKTDIEYYNRGMMKAHEGGFVDLWYNHILADSSRCTKPLRNRSSDKIRLGLGGLSGAFVVLAFGYTLSVLVFLGEKIHNRCLK